jgi:hypothetical protein
MDKVRKPSNCECYAQSSEPFRIYWKLRVQENSWPDEKEWKTKSGPQENEIRGLCKSSSVPEVVKSIRKP